MKKEDCFELGYIRQTHGLKGELTVIFDVDEPQEYEDLDSVFIEQKGQLVPFIVESLNIAGGKVIMKLEEVDSVVKAQTLKGSKLYLPLTLLPQLEEDTFYYHEIIGYDVHDQNKGYLGKVKTIYNLPAQDLIALDYKNAEVLIPINEHIVLKIETETKTIITQLPEGLLEVYTDPLYDE